MLYRLLYRHLRETQFPDPAQKFQVLGVPIDQNVTEELFTTVFAEMELNEEEIKHIMATYMLGDLKIK